MRKCKFMSLNQDSSRNLLVLIDMFHFWRLDDSYLTSSANFAFTIKLPGLLMNLRNPAMRQVLMCTQEVCYAEVEPCPESCAAGERRCSLPQHEHRRSCSLAVPSIPLWWKWTHTYTQRIDTLVCCGPIWLSSVGRLLWLLLFFKSQVIWRTTMHLDFQSSTMNAARQRRPMLE